VRLVAGGAPRGASFLLSPNRLNVAVSRAQALAIIVECPALLAARCQSCGRDAAGETALPARAVRLRPEPRGLVPRSGVGERRSGDPKIQRWIDLLAAILTRKHPATLDQASGTCPDLRPPRSTPVARNTGPPARKLEREKDKLRSYRIPIETRRTHEDE
jgi:hypothetical protein